MIGKPFDIGGMIDLIDGISKNTSHKTNIFLVDRAIIIICRMIIEPLTYDRPNTKDRQTPTGNGGDYCFAFFARWWWFSFSCADHIDDEHTPSQFVCLVSLLTIYLAFLWSTMSCACLKLIQIVPPGFFYGFVIAMHSADQQTADQQVYVVTSRLYFCTYYGTARTLSLRM